MVSGSVILAAGIIGMTIVEDIEMDIAGIAETDNHMFIVAVLGHFGTTSLYLVWYIKLSRHLNLARILKKKRT
jgi:hypothetical protein